MHGLGLKCFKFEIYTPTSLLRVFQHLRKLVCTDSCSITVQQIAALLADSINGVAKSRAVGF
jgi:hypothetical protein